MTRPAARSAALAAALAAAGALTLTACGDSGDPASHLTACQVVTKSDIHQVIPDMTVTPPPTDTDTEHVCLYSGDGASVTVTFEQHAGDGRYQHDENTDRGQKGARVHDLDGLGDEAFSYVSGDGAIVAAETRIGDTVLQVKIRNYVVGGTGNAAKLVKRGVHRVRGGDS